MATAYVKRLKESKKKTDQQDLDRGAEFGAEWAAESASYADLDRLARGPEIAHDNIEGVAEFLGYEWDELVPDYLDGRLFHSSPFAEGFVAGALAIFAEVFMP